MLIRKLGEAGDLLVRALVCNADCVVGSGFVEFDHSRVAFTVVEEDGVGELGLYIMAVDGVYPHWVFVDGDDGRFQTHCANKIYAHPFVGGVNLNNLHTPVGRGTA